MLKKAVIAIVSLFLLSGCTGGFRDYFKKSANNKYIDSKGFKGEKRKPLYNKKYINTAKKNIINEDVDDDEDDDIDDIYQTPSSSKINRQMYADMVKQDAKRRKRERMAQYRSDYPEEDYIFYEDKSYPSLSRAKEKSDKEVLNNQELQKEISEIKAMLGDAKKDLAKYRCPMQQNSENTIQTSEEVLNAKPLDKAPKTKLKKKFIEEDDDYEKTNPI